MADANYPGHDVLLRALADAPEYYEMRLAPVDGNAVKTLRYHMQRFRLWAN